MILHEVHTKNLNISYGFNMPAIKTPTSWWVIKYWKYRYIRFTVPKWVYNFINDLKYSALYPAWENHNDYIFWRRFNSYRKYIKGLSKNDIC